MLYRYLCQSLALLLVLFSAGGNAEIYYNKPQLCAYACYDTISALTFGDFDPELEYIGMRCSSRLAVSSVYACFDLRCSSKYTPEESFGYLEAYCELYGPATLNGTYDEVIQDVIAQYGSIDNVTVVDPTTFTDIVNTTVVTPEENWALSQRTLYAWQHEMHMHHAFGWSMYVMAAGVLFIGVLHRLTAFVTHRLLAKRPLPIDAEHSAAVVGKGTAPNSGFLTKVNNLWAKHILLPATFGYRHIQPWGWCTIPTRLQSILVFIYFALNFIFCAVDWQEFPNNTYWVLPTDQFWRYFSDRTGIICFANLPLVWLFAGRNDVLLWLTGWSFSTFNVFHRYAARIATVQGILHSIGYTVIYYRATNDWSSYNAELPEQWFYTGIAATVLMSVLLGLSIYPLRAKVYELFLAIHVAFSLVILIFLFLHVKIMDGEYDAYLWACAGFWVFDRFLRLARIVVLNYRVILPGKNDPLKRSAATAAYDPDGDIIRLTVRPSANFLVGAGIHYYIYTPTASMFRLWENHPFTLGTWKQVPKDGCGRAHEGSLHEHDPSSPTVTDTKSISTGEVELHATQQELMFLIRPYKGMTNTLKKQLLKAPGHTKDIRILLEGPYGVPADLRQYERVLMISGGSGVTGLLAYLYEFEKLAQEGKSEGRKLRFAWAAREPRFVADVVEKDLPQFVGRADTRLDFFMTRGEDKVNLVEQAVARATHHNGLEKSTNAVVSYSRPDIAGLLEEEISQLVTDVSRLAIVVCGPGRLADDVRREVVRVVGSKIDASRIELYEESFGW